MTTKAQKNLLKQLMLHEKTVDTAHKGSLAAIVRNGWYDLEAGIITAEGMLEADIPTKQQTVLQLTHPYSYMGQLLPKGTNIMVVMARKIKRYTIIEGIMNVGGKSVGVRVYKPATAIFTEITVPDLEALGVS